MIKPNQPLLSILFIARDDGGCGFFRCRQPAAFLNRLGLLQAKVVQNKATEAELLGADLVIMQEMGSENASNIARFCIEKKIPFVTEFDDFVHHVSPRNHSGFGAWNPGTLYVHRSMEMTKAAFAVTVSTNQLAREYFPYNPTIFVIPNFLDKDAWDHPIAKRGDGKIRIGWCGGNAHADDLAMISPVITKLIKKYKGKVVFETMGMTRQELAGVFPLEQVPEACLSCGYEGEVKHSMGESLQNYPMVLMQKGWDIAVAPVINNAFGNCKSDLKIKEYSAAGLPIVASPVVPYREAAQNGAHLLFAETFEEWYTNLDRLIKKAALRADLAAQNKRWIGKFWMQDNIQKINDIYLMLIEQGRKVLGPKEERLKI